jgi:RNA polymerase sigma factor (sigma-70 family)
MATTLRFQTHASLLTAAGDPANEEARAKFAETYGPLIREACRGQGLQESDQDDVAQAVLCQLFAKVLPRFTNRTLVYDPNRRFRGLLQTMIHRAIADLYRARQRRPGDCGSGDTQVRGLLHEAPAPDDRAIRDLAEEVTRQVAGQIERDQRLHEACERVRRRVQPHIWQALWLTTVEGEPAAAVAERIGMSNGAVAQAKHRVTKMIRSEAGEMA